MKRQEVVVAASVVAMLAVSPAAFAQQCPAEISEAKAKIASLKKAQKEVKAPRTAAGARAQDIQAPRGQEQQAPRGQEQQAPRAAAGARGQDATGTQTKIGRAEKLVTQAEQLCKKGDMAASGEKARAALDALK